MGRPADVVGHLPQFLRVLEQVSQYRSQLFGGEFFLGNCNAALGAGNVAGIGRLVIIRGGGQRYQDRGQAGSGDFKNRRGAGPGNNQVRCRIKFRHIFEKGGNIYLAGTVLVAGLDVFDVSFAALLGDG